MTKHTFKQCLIVLLLSISIVLSQSTDNSTQQKDKAKQRQKVTFIEPGSIQYLSNSFGHILVFFLQSENKQYEQLYQQNVDQLVRTYPQDNTLYAVTYFSNDTYGKLGKFNNKTDGFRIITKNNHYQMDFNDEIRQFQLLKRFYTNHVHPLLPVLDVQQYSSVQTQQFIVMQYNTREQLQNCLKVYSKIYDYLKIFNVRAVATEGESNATKIHVYSKTKLSTPSATFGGEVNNTEELLEFINVETLRLVTIMDDENYVRVFGSFLDTQFLLIYDKQDINNEQIVQLRKVLHETARFNKEEQLKYQRILFAESTIQFMAKYFDHSLQEIQDENGNRQLYKLLMTKTDYGHFQLRRFIYESEKYGQASFESLAKFIEDVRMKKIDSEYKSDKVLAESEQQGNILRKIVGKSFIKEIFERPNESVVVLFVDSKDERSYKDIKTAFEEFTQKYKSILRGKVVSGIFDLALNENKLLSIRTAPLLALFQKSNKKSPKYFKGYPKVQAIKNWINYQLKDFTIPDNFGKPILPLRGSDPLDKIIQNQKIQTKQL